MENLETITEEEEAEPIIGNLDRKKEAQELFFLCDKEHRGYVTVRDLQQLREELGLSVEQIGTVFAYLDKDEDGHLTSIEFEEGLELFLKQSILNYGGQFNVTEKLEPKTIQSTSDRRLLKLPQHSYRQKIEQINPEIIGMLQKSENSQQFWSYMQAEYPELVPHLEEFLRELALEHRKIKEETVILQDSFNRKSLAYEERIQALYQEMETQIQKERDDVTMKKIKLEKQLRHEFEEAHSTKDRDTQDIREKWFKAEKELQTAIESKTLTTQENKKLLQEKEKLENDLEVYQRNIAELLLQLQQTREDKILEKRQHSKSALQFSEKMAWERETLDKQLSLLRSINKRLTDDRDEMTAELAPTRNPEITAGNCQLHSKRGSVMADYFGVSSGYNEFFDDDSSDKCNSPGTNSSTDNIQFSDVTRVAFSPAMCRVHPNNHSVEQPFRETLMHCKELQRRSRTLSTRSTLPQSIFKVVFIGDSSVGKTSIINRICNIQFKESIGSTIGVDFRIHGVVCNGREIVLQMWDTAGQERYRSITNQYMRRSDAVILVYDVTSEHSYRNVAQWMVTLEASNNNTPALVLTGNKVDSDRKVVATHDGEKLANDMSALFFETSAKTGAGIEFLVFSLASKLHKNQLEDIESTLKLTAKSSETTKKTCCL